ncbi:MAG: formate dehydrogenase accessory sulfurtransferase FdhD [Anaerolineae bacterium]|nr:formate dehydrogenase accessory sulfurtransferase FdhD [Anaerolineae bacterium]
MTDKITTSHLYEERDLVTFQDGRKSSNRQPIVTEMPLTIILNGDELATLVCSPHSFDLLAIGFLVSEGILQRHDDLKAVSCRQEQGVVWVDTIDGVVPTDGFLQRNFTSCCGKGRPSLPFLNDYRQIQPITHTSSFTATELLDFVSLLDREAQTYRLTGGVHEAALARKGGFVTSYEDIGRHNALDRILGYTFLNDIDTSDKAVVLSGRIASEMLTKAARIGVPVVVSRAAPTCLSIDLAEQLGITVVGFARGSSLNVYTHPERVME